MAANLACTIAAGLPTDAGGLAETAGRVLAVDGDAGTDDSCAAGRARTDTADSGPETSDAGEPHSCCGQFVSQAASTAAPRPLAAAAPITTPRRACPWPERLCGALLTVANATIWGLANGGTAASRIPHSRQKLAVSLLACPHAGQAKSVLKCSQSPPSGLSPGNPSQPDDSKTGVPAPEGKPADNRRNDPRFLRRWPPGPAWNPQDARNARAAHGIGGQHN